jgi:hypothetical protein
MLRYEVYGRVLTITVKGTPTDDQRESAYTAIALDGRVPRKALVLLDGRRADSPGSPQDVEARARALVRGIGSKLGPACAVIVSPRLFEEAQHFQVVTTELGLKVGVFQDELQAREWLETFESE